MALIVEDGTGLATAESYISDDDAGTYFNGRLGGELWDSDEYKRNERERALRFATELIDQECQWQTPSVPTSTTQALDWPRYPIKTELGNDTIPNNVIPTLLKEATAELALRLLRNPGFRDELDTVITSSSSQKGSRTSRPKRPSILGGFVERKLRPFCRGSSVPMERVA